ncbi:hypothetical protein TELCIR_07649 [Teladorsagia circumcincta]|uniref:Uncharacterized protein n=1 Tax=Teladorsagia circumcincta TaxID=45464 RepID=A0A2G9UJQ5_TELCI|nr:hypothetical protein TELCIR_07649 [Teladorsagia circumcincta]
MQQEIDCGIALRTYHFSISYYEHLWDGKKPKQRQFFLFNDILVYGNIVISKKRYNKQRIIPLENVELEDLPDEGG